MPYGVLISGGLDSSIIAAIAAKFAEARVETHDRTQAWWPRLHSFCHRARRLARPRAARKVGRSTSARCTMRYTFTVQEGFDALRDVIYHLETFDMTTIRASTPMYLMVRKIKSMGIKMVLSGEGADESLRRLPLLPQGARRAGVPRGDRPQALDCCTNTTACAPTSPQPRGASRRACPFLDGVPRRRHGIDPARQDAAPGRMEKYLLREAFEDISRTRSCGGRRSSSPTAWATAGSTR